ncbi:MAG: hypothetical protein M3Q53_04665 [Actinomycetota bacterium]|nr:hypothetical protein [Actinomycetota bacterium]
MAIRIGSEANLHLDPRELAATLQPLERATMLPPAAFADPAVLDWEMENVFAGWVCCGHASSVSEPGSYLMRELGRSSVFVIGGEAGEPRAFLNACRHHDEVRSAVVGGLILVDPSGEAPDPLEHVGELADLLELYRLSSLLRAEAKTYEVDANWKAIAENYNECLHCPGVHPELNALSDYRSGQTRDGPGAWCGGSMRLNEGAETMGRGHGKASSRPPIQGLPPEELDAVYYFALFPNALVSLHPDYVMLHTLWPRATDRTAVVCEWYFEPATIARTDFDPRDAVEFWDQVNREDWRVCELTQKGVRTRGYVAGRYSAQENDVHAFDSMVARSYLNAVNERGQRGEEAVG